MQVGWDTVLSYLMHHPRWFESFERRAAAPGHLERYRAAMPADWGLWRRGYWLIAEPPGVPSVRQGWKLHVSATSRNSADVLAAALPVLREANVRFKFLMDPAAVRECNSKSFSRGSSGKFITVYPVDDEQFRAVAARLTEALQGFEGPYILSDRRCPGSRMVYYRYGGFVSRFRMQPLGQRELLIDAPDGRRIPDVRNPYFSAPDWARDPFDGDADSPAAGGRDLADGRFTVTDAISFSNRGGVYLGTDNETGETVVLREARPHVEVGRDGTEATALLRHEYDLLTELADTGLFVRPVAFFHEWEHAFLVEEYIEGPHFGHLSIEQNPLCANDLSPRRLSGHYARFRDLWLQIADAIAVCHARGIVLGDLSPTNILVTEDDRIRLIDMESAFHEGLGGGAGLTTPGMTTRRALAAGCGDRRTDYYAFAGLMLCTVFAYHQADAVDRTVPHELLAELGTDLALPVELTTLIGELYTEDAELPDPVVLRERIAAIPFTWQSAPPLAGPPVREPMETARLHKRVESTLDGVADYLCAVPDTTRTDRLFPADLMVFETNPLSLAHGAYGPLYALQTVRGEVPGELRAWALARPSGPQTLPPGLYYGSAGVAWAQLALGLPEVAAATLRATRGHPLLHDGAGVLTGAAGYGMACLRLWHDLGLSEFLDDAIEVGERLGATAVHGDVGAHWVGPRGRVPIGYGDGASGVAYFLLALHAATGSADTLALGRSALAFDLSTEEYPSSGIPAFPAAVAPDGKPAAVLRQYWDEGTTGVLTTALRYASVLGDAASRRTVEHLLPDVRRKHAAFPQLFHGMSGIGNVLLDAYEYLGDEDLLGAAERTAAAVLRFAVHRPEGIVFPGEQVLRESADLASGSAGVALFLHRLGTAAPGRRTNTNFMLDDVIERAR